MDGLAAAEVNNNDSKVHLPPRAAADAAPLIYSNGCDMAASSPGEFGPDRGRTSKLSIITQPQQQQVPLYGQLRSPHLPSRDPLRHNFHRPEHFSYKETPVFGKAKKKTGMAELLSPVRTQPVVVRRSKSPGRTMEAEEAIRMSTYPDGEPPKPGATAPIERDDFPAPLAEAVFLPELLRRSQRKKGRRSYAGSDHAVDENGDKEYEDDDDVDGDSEISPKLKREILAASKLSSPMVRDIITELTVAPEKKPVDPRDSSRAPSAKGRLAVPPRFSSSINASPSRSTDRPRRSAESAARQRRATCPTDLSPSPMCSPSLDRRPVPTAYTSGTRSATLPPPGTPGAFVYDPFTDDDDEDGPYSIVPRSTRSGGVANGGRSPSIASSLEKRRAYASSTGDVDSVFERESLYRSSSRSDCYSYADQTNSCGHFERSSLLRCSNMSDSVALLRDLVQPKTPKKSTASVGDGVPFLNAATLDTRKRSECALLMWEEQLFEPEQPYAYDEVKLTSDKRRKGLDETKLEKYLSTADFETALGMTREDFYRLPEFKRNDIKLKADLF